MTPVLCIHGINSNGAWAERLQPIFDEDFCIAPIRYTHYKSFGICLLLFEPLLLLLALPVMAISAVALPTVQARYWLFSLAMSMTLAPVLILGAHFRRRRAMQKVWSEIRGYMGNNNPIPHVIAHSLGSYLFGRLLAERRGQMRTDHVIFAGSVLDANWDWEAVRSSNKDAYIHVRNDWSPKDHVARLAWLLCRLIPHFGSAGCQGFLGGESIHHVGHPRNRCDRCRVDQKAQVHNYRCDDYEHSDALVSPEHAARYWLPHLLKIDQVEYDALLERCENHGQLHKQGHVRQRDRVLRDIAEHQPGWLHGLDVQTYLRDMVEDDPRWTGTDSSRLAHECLIAFVKSLDRGRIDTRRAQSPQQTWERCLNPMLCARKAVDAAFGVQ